uniref:NADH-ubiquinone oxidoreductase chain 3 n=1 Tax=Paroedura picta TaxID=143630 RepID=A0A0U2IB62_9SAUR|nr:NADH dehydrogenase subunit 3 [Paroedura picta]ALF04036.1 NADH dehydrogenase subunit 3 [Paroedura picta]BBI76360.1 NADH dehydrogenase subunit 3 [Paroedura picta]
MKISSLILSSATLPTALIIISLWLPQTKSDVEKLSPYECGFDPLGTARLPFSLRFFLIAILFLLFDLEIALLLPTPWAINSTSPQTALLLMVLLILILILGLAYEWQSGGLEWAD